MQLITSLSAASAMVATVSAIGAIALNKGCDSNLPHASIYNHCDYPVYLWSVFKGDGCPKDQMYTLSPGGEYKENLQDPKGGLTGISIKMSKTQTCGGQDIAQLEYYLEKNKPGFNNNYLDMSYVDCLGGNCPTKKEGYHLIAGSQTGKNVAGAKNTWCPILSCNDAASCASMSYIMPDDVQTKTCSLDQNMELHLCGSPDKDSKPAPAPSKPSAPAAPAAPSSSAAKDPTSVKPYIAAAVVTPEAEIKEDSHKNIKTEVVYVTQYVNAKRHAHGHARRHQPFHA